jgi:RNA polymerase sigma factor (sigma-70 family)
MNEQQLWDEMIATHIREGQQYAAQGVQAAADHQFRTAFEVLVRSYQRAVVGFCAHMLREWTVQAEDIAQDVFLAIWKTLPQFRHEARIRTWVFTIARYHCVDAWDQQARHASSHAFPERQEEDPPAVAPAVHEQYEHAEFFSWVKQALVQLPPAEREVLESLWKQNLYKTMPWFIYLAKLRTDLLDNRSLAILLETYKLLICYTLVFGQPLSPDLYCRVATSRDCWGPRCDRGRGPYAAAAGTRPFARDCCP